MAKIIALGEYQAMKSQERFEEELQKEIRKVEENLNIPEDEPLLVLTDMNAITIGEHLLDARDNILDARDNINKVLDILGIEESEVLPDE